jgi:hypothetical protein
MTNREPEGAIGLPSFRITHENPRFDGREVFFLVHPLDAKTAGEAHFTPTTVHLAAQLEALSAETRGELFRPYLFDGSLVSYAKMAEAEATVTVAVRPVLRRAILAENKWRDYEHDYILPCFKLAEAAGIDLPALVREGGGNCVVKLVRELTKQRDEARSGYHELDKNWEAHHEACMRQIRAALGAEDASVPELVERITALRAEREGERE